MTQQTIKTEYKRLSEIAERLEHSEAFILKLIQNRNNPLPARKVGREWWITETKIQEWLNN